jgi:hypothetical protein
MAKPVLSCLLALITACVVSACAHLTVKSDVNPALAASVHCRTYAFIGSFNGDSPLRGTIANPINEGRLRDAIAAHLNAIGAQPATTDADCLVGYGIGAQQVISAAYPAGWGYGWGYGWGWGYGYGWPGYYYPYVYHEGIITVDIYDAKTRQAFWHASTNQNLIGTSGQEAAQKINEAVALMFTKYPGGSASAPPPTASGTGQHTPGPDHPGSVPG